MQVTPTQTDGKMQGKYLGTGTEFSLSYILKRDVVILSS